MPCWPRCPSASGARKRPAASLVPLPRRPGRAPPPKLDGGAADPAGAPRADILDLHRMAALGVHQRRLPVDVPRTPRGQSAHDHAELTPLVAQRVLRARRMLGVEPARAPPSA